MTNSVSSPLNQEKKRLSFFYILLAACGLILFFVHGCTKTNLLPCPPGKPKPYKALGKWYQPLPHSDGFRQRGIASWYGKKFHGKKTSSGEIYNMYELSAAHKTLPLGTYVRVYNLKNSKNIDVRINDRGPFVRGRIIDLSYAAAKKLGIVDSGTAPVEIVALGAAAKPEAKSGTSRSYVSIDYYNGNFTFQVGAFKDPKNAERLKQKLDRTYKNSHITIYDNADETFYRVRIGKCSTLKQAMEFENTLIQDGFKDAFTVAE